MAQLADSATTFSRVPPAATPTLMVVPASGRASPYIHVICLAISRTALAPRSGSMPACAGIPRTASS